MNMLSKTILTKEKKSPERGQKRFLGFLITPLMMILLVAVFMSQCKKDDYEGEIKGVCPLVISTDPADGALNVVQNKVITATFNEDMDPATINTASFILMQGTNPISGTVTQMSGQKATFSFTPANPLASATLYTATMKKGVRDPMKNALQKDYVWSFTTAVTQPYTVTLSSNPPEGGATTGAGTFNSGDSVTVKAVRAAGYIFVNWTEGENIVSTSAEYIFTITGNRALVANFTIGIQQQYTVTLSSSPQEGGTTSGGGTFDSGASVTVRAVAAGGVKSKDLLHENLLPKQASRRSEWMTAEIYVFANWTEGENVVSTSADYTFTLNGNRTLVANFTTAIPQYTVTLLSNPTAGGTVTGGGTFDPGTSVSVNAIPAVGYTFTNWTEGINVVSSSASYTFTLTDNRTLVANFTSNIPQFTVTLSSNPLAGGTTTGGGTFDTGTSVTAKAVPSSGYTFTNWTEGGSIVSTSANYTFVITQNRSLVANFTATTQQYSVTLSSNPPLRLVPLSNIQYHCHLTPCWAEQQPVEVCLIQVLR